MKKWLFLLVILVILSIFVLVFALQYDFGGKKIHYQNANNPSEDNPDNEIMIPGVIYPNSVEGFGLISDQKNTEDCSRVEDLPDSSSLGLTGEVCIGGNRLSYQNGDQITRIDVAVINKGLNLYEQIVRGLAKTVENTDAKVFTSEPGELVWFSGASYMIMTQQQIAKTSLAGDTTYSRQNYSMSNPVMVWFLENYPPRAI